MIKRTISNNIQAHLKEPEMTVLIGPPQAGKTYLMRILEEKLKAKGAKTLFLSLDIDDHKSFFVSQANLIDYIHLQVGDTKAYVFIDEIQRKEDAGLFLKDVYDRQLPYKFIISGSGSLDLKAKIKESMAGRKQLFQVLPISFEEFANFKTNYQYENRLQDFFSIEEIKAQSFLQEYMTFGGYPRVVIANVVDKKKSEMNEIYTSYIERDISDLLRVEKPDAFKNLLKIMASQIGNLVNITELASTIGISEKTVAHYLWYLEQTFILQKVTPYYRNIRSEITKAPMYYFYDTGLRNYLLGIFGLPEIPQALAGYLFENVIFGMIRQKESHTSTSVHFWRTRDNAEVDFVLETGLDVLPIEVKYKRMDKPETTRSYRSFLARYKPKIGYIVHLGKEVKIQIDNTTVLFVPFSHLIAKNFFRM